MAEPTKMTNKERRAASRAERKRKEEEAAKKARRDRLRNTGISALVLAIIGYVVVLAFQGRETIDAEIQLARADVDGALAAAGCEVLDVPELPDRGHHDPQTAPPADALYGALRPTHSGSHFSATNPLVRSGARNQLDERATTHNLEHGAVIAWYDPDQLESSQITAMEGWSARLNDSGFGFAERGSGIFVSPYTDPGISSGKAVALRAWGVAMDCDTWDDTVGYSFVIDNFGTHGGAPERTLAPYPAETLGYSDVEVEDNTEAPTGDRTEEASDMVPTEGEEPDGSTEGISGEPTPTGTGSG